MRQFIQNELSKTKAVELVLVEQEGSLFHVTIMIDRPDDAVLDRIIGTQERIITGLTEYGFDFTVIFPNGKISQEVPLLSEA